MDIETAHKRLHHLSMRYVGSFLEAATGQAVGLLGSSHPGLHETRDLIDLILLCRAELNGITRLLIDKGVFTEEELTDRFADEYQWITEQKAKMLNVEVADYGLVFRNKS